MPSPRTASARSAVRTPVVPTVRLGSLTDGPAPAAGGEYEGVAYGPDLRDVRAPGAHFVECELAQTTADTWAMGGCRLVDVVVRDVGVATLQAPESTWRDVVVESSRVGALDLAGAHLLRVVLRGVKAGWVNLRGSTVTDLSLLGCTIDDLDLGGATVTRMAVDGKVATLRLHESRSTHLDLRHADLSVLEGLTNLGGVVLTAEQAHDLGPALVRQLGGTVDDGSGKTVTGTS